MNLKKLKEIIKKDWLGDFENVENSIILRLLILINTLISFIYTIKILQNDGREINLLISIIIIIFGNILSYVLRYKKKIFLKILLSLSLIYISSIFINDLKFNYIDSRYPLLQLLYYLQIAHSYDLPEKKDLIFSVILSITMMTITASLSTNSNFLYILILFVFSLNIIFIFNTTLVVNKDKEIKLLNNDLIKSSFYITILIILITIFLFFTLPVFPSLAKTLFFPFLANNSKFKNITKYLPKNKNFKFLNPKPEDKNISNQLTGGKNDYIDLNYRFTLSNELLFTLKTNFPYYIKAKNFDYYDGKSWSISDKDYKEITGSFNEIYINNRYNNLFTKKNIIQQYEIYKNLSNNILRYDKAKIIYLGINSIYKDKNNNLYTPYPLFKGLKYTVISNINNTTLNNLKNLYTYQIFDNSYINLTKYLQLPINLPDKIKDLSYNITKNYTDELSKVLAIKHYLLKNYKYSFNIPHLQGKDAVYRFLFIDKKGYCQQFASAMVVMLRSISIPARLCTGFYPEKYNIFTGLYEIRDIDAHAWVEVYFPLYGWQIFDPTPVSINFNKKNYYNNLTLTNILYNFIKKMDIKINKNSLKINKKNIIFFLFIIFTIIMLIYIREEIKRVKNPLKGMDKLYLKLINNFYYLYKNHFTPYEFATNIKKHYNNEKIDEFIKLYIEYKYSNKDINYYNYLYAKKLIKEIINLNKQGFFTKLEKYLNKK